uniref:hypothetical protein n=1 Tax=Enterobacter hormaechei TaxID=158836 RepID=UPI0013D2C0FF
GTLNAALVQFGGGLGSIEFNHTEAAHNFAPVIAGAGAINQIAGTTILTANSSNFTGVTNVLGGKLIVNGALGSNVNVTDGGILG